MLNHLRASLWLLFLTLGLCCVLYPLSLWAVGQTLFRHQANGSLLLGPDRQPVGSRLIAQPFSGDEYFQPRPSATSPAPYNAAASGGSNLAANNPKLRGRVAQTLGTLVRYRSPAGPGKGKLAGEEVEKWFQAENNPAQGAQRRDLAAEWAAANSSLLAGWATSADPISAYIKQWAKDHAGVQAAWRKKNPGANEEPKAEDLAPLLFDPSIADSFVNVHPGMWPVSTEVEKDGKKEKVVRPANAGDDLRSLFFDMWLSEHRDADLELVPSDLVTTSGSGLDPHITLKNAHYQLERVVAKWAEKTKQDPAQVRDEILRLLQEKTESPLGGLAGVPLVNVLEVNLALAQRLSR